MASSIFSCYLLFRKKKQHKYIHVCDIAVCDTEEQTSKMKAVKHKLCPFFPVRTQNYRCTDIKTQINKKNRNTAIQSSLHICCRMKQLPWFAGVCLARKEEMLMDSIAIYRNAVSSALTHRSTMLHVVLPKCAWLHSSLLAIVFVFNHSCKMQLSD